jgi:hypothetical protein
MNSEAVLPVPVGYKMNDVIDMPLYPRVSVIVGPMNGTVKVGSITRTVTVPARSADDVDVVLMEPDVV